jgi:hypothetical protein
MLAKNIHSINHQKIFRNNQPGIGSDAAQKQAIENDFF